MPDSKRDDFLTTAIKAAKVAGDIILCNLCKISKNDIGLKQASDFVTHVDRESENAIIRIIKEDFPDHHFLAEESDRDADTGTYLWIIDPLDGTTNYIHGFPVFAISIALQHKNEIVTGVIFDPYKDELFTAEKGKGAFLMRSFF